MKKYLAVCVFLLCALGLFSQANNEEKAKSAHQQFLSYFNSSKYDEAVSVLKKWQDIDEKNPELYIDYFNLYIAMGTRSGIAIDRKENPHGANMTVTDPKTSEIVGYIHDSTTYDTEYTAKAILAITEGLKYGQDRLDMYFGKTHFLNQICDYKTASETVILILSRSKKNKNNWLWSENKKIDDPKIFMLDNLNDYYVYWLEANTEESIKGLEAVSKKQIELYPNSVYAYNFLAYSYVLKNKKGEAIPVLLDAEKINKTDAIILSNLARLFDDTGDEYKAKEYWTKVLKYADAQLKELAAEKLKKY